MWAIAIGFIKSETAKVLIALLVKKLLDHSSDGVTKDVAATVLDAIAKSRANDVPADAFDFIKREYLK